MSTTWVNRITETVSDWTRRVRASKFLTFVFLAGSTGKVADQDGEEIIIFSKTGGHEEVPLIPRTKRTPV